MTREEAKELLIHVLMTYEPRDQYGDLDDSEPYEEAMTMAIEALRNCSEKPNGSLISKEDVKWQIQEWIAELNEAIDVLDSIPSAEPLVLTCDGCRHVGTYDTDFPCAGCIRREKDYYEQER